MTTATSARPRRSRIAAGLSALTLTAGALIAAAATPALADEPHTYCGLKVVGAIEQRYVGMGGPTGQLGCPLTQELVNPDGVGRRTQFKNGTIYWHPQTGAWPVWGDIGARWCQEGCERGWLGYPTSGEYRAGNAAHQNFGCGTIYWQAWPERGTMMTRLSENRCI
ncbi:hypothetical protein AB0L05_17055 [Nonomuraea pusilla]|uniref:LGFP repeat-containing protein n=1 Tax=Nonomuraea pusilla TaxID=46177 RepID=UPI00332A23BA